VALNLEPSGTTAGIRHYEAILENARAVKALLLAEDPESIFLIGGECSTELMPVSFLRHKYGEDLAVLWFDAHADLNVGVESPSGNIQIIAQIIIRVKIRRWPYALCYPLSEKMNERIAD
jgi:arginase